MLQDDIKQLRCSKYYEITTVSQDRKGSTKMGRYKLVKDVAAAGDVDDSAVAIAAAAEDDEFAGDDEAL